MFHFVLVEKSARNSGIVLQNDLAVREKKVAHGEKLLQCMRYDAALRKLTPTPCCSQNFMKAGIRSDAVVARSVVK